MRSTALIPPSLLAVLLHAPAYGQLTDFVEVLAQAERAFPDAKAPQLFGPGSASSAFAEEADDSDWSSEMEARILAAIDSERNQGLIVRRAEVECRTTTCAVLLVHVADREDGRKGDLFAAFRDSLGFVGVNKAEIEVPLQQRNAEGGVSTWFLSGYIDVLLTAGR